MSESLSSSSFYSNNNTKTWQSYKEDGKKYYNEEQNYQKALECYEAALKVGQSSIISIVDQQIILSNTIACRLKLANAHRDIEQAYAARDDAKRCITLDPTWSKGHVRLASSYMMIQSLSSSQAAPGVPNNINYSNDICNTLQTALRYDPTNHIAKQMLVQELRRRSGSSGGNHEAAATPTSSGTHTRNEPPSPSSQGDNPNHPRDPPVNPSFIPSSTSSEQQRPTTSSSEHSSSQRHDRGMNYDSNNYHDIDDQNHDDSVRWNQNDNNNYISVLYQQLHHIKMMIGRYIGQLRDMIQQTMIQYQTWYYHQSPDVQTGIQILALLLLLYIAFGGRFGLNYLFSNHHHSTKSSSSSYRSATTTTKGNYGTNNVYDQYRRQQQQQQSSSSTTRQDNDNHHHQSAQYHNNHHNDAYPHSHQHQHHHNNGGSFSDMFAPFGGFQNVMMIAVVMYICHKNGIHPLNALMMVNTMTGRRGGGFYYNNGGFGGGGGFGNFGGFGGGGWGGGYRHPRGGRFAPRHRW